MPRRFAARASWTTPAAMHSPHKLCITRSMIWRPCFSPRWQSNSIVLNQRIFEHLQRSNCAAEKVGDDEEHCGDNEIADRAACDDCGRHCAPLLDAKMQTP